MFKILLLNLIFILCFACVKDQGNMVFAMKSGDFKQNCEKLEQEILDINSTQIKKLRNKKKLKILRNTALLALTIPSLFTSLLFVDFSGNETKTINIYQDRIEHLEQIMAIKECRKGS